MSTMRRTPLWKKVDCSVCGRKVGETCRMLPGTGFHHYQRMAAAKAQQQAERRAALEEVEESTGAV